MVMQFKEGLYSRWPHGLSFEPSQVQLFPRFVLSNGGTGVMGYLNRDFSR